MLFVDIYAQNVNFGYLTILGKLGVSTTLVDGSSKSMVDFRFALIEVYSLSATVPELRGEMCTARLFSQAADLLSTSLHLNFTWTASPRINQN